MPVLRKRIVTGLLAGLLAIALVFAGVACGNDDSSPSEPETPQVGS